MSTVGYWRSPTFPFLPDPNDYVDPSWDAVEREAVVRHLYSGRLQYAHGTWSWPEDLVHYVLVHQVRPDRAFVDWVLAGSRSGSAPDAG